MSNDEGELRFSSLFDESHVFCGLRTQDRDKAIEALVSLLVRAGAPLDKRTALGAVIEREKLLCTAVSPGLAIPHARLPGLNEMQVAIGTS